MTTAPLVRQLEGQLAAIASGLAVAWEWRPQLLRVSGREPLAALDRIVSQAVKDLSPGEGRLALVLHARGQFRGLFAVLGGDGEALLLAPPGRADDVSGGLQRYLALSRCRLDPASGVATATLLGPGWEAVAGACGADLERLRGGGWSATADGEDRLTWCGWTFLGVPGVVILVSDQAAARRLERRIADAGAVPAGDEALELARIAAAWPAWGAELTESTLPPEIAVLDYLAISYRKGCYTGQETIARMKTYGHPNWRLARLQQVAGPATPPSLPTELFLDGGERTKGRLTSWALHPAQGGIGLALVHRSLPGGSALVDRQGREFHLTS